MKVKVIVDEFKDLEQDIKHPRNKVLDVSKERADYLVKTKKVCEYVKKEEIKESVKEEE